MLYDLWCNEGIKAQGHTNSEHKCPWPEVKWFIMNVNVDADECNQYREKSIRWDKIGVWQLPIFKYLQPDDIDDINLLMIVVEDI